MARRALLVLVNALVAATPAAADNVIGRKERVDTQIDALNDKISAARARTRARG
jgi:hypothetical protein